jgi:DNA modification methylase
MKPIELVTCCLNNSVPRNGVVLDPFCGSGTTLAACEQRGALGRGVELSEAFAAVILERMAGMGLEPRLADGP